MTKAKLALSLRDEIHSSAIIQDFLINNNIQNFNFHSNLDMVEFYQDESELNELNVVCVTEAETLEVNSYVIILGLLLQRSIASDKIKLKELDGGKTDATIELFDDLALLIKNEAKRVLKKDGIIVDRTLHKAKTVEVIRDERPLGQYNSNMGSLIYLNVVYKKCKES